MKKKYKNLSPIQKKEVKRKLEEKKQNLERIISIKKFQEFKKIILQCLAIKFILL